ncbi:bifunctional phosphoribosylaminoimidazolecarboxamide formyltransferase/IMP cyclohydrolase [Alicyclobacillus fastidiosus]|uniref:Bifunctional purine biosynthesis protein PurH n=1 Tax=Alicyclobacillus fastidiosus TaxID=392011 RepID=A0ABV5AF28_9BACL|nr:bifunctional phosphoribosylaminoimidazolecarboxamide formyltransferase/IMP cyclohydrolase [Alicyclobacillus fastidiosus]WEH09395.1 bifunctional phosphoribosylaminoimidazolecarboxamide formyltransferase/IMP cyclohydrolase [Alicyclobacillus fastidiosus]
MQKWALVSVFEKDGIVPFCQSLQELGFGILSTGNTAKHLAEHGLTVTTVESYTGFEEILDGRVKTLHPHIHGGLLARRDNAEHLAQLEKFGIEMIDLVVVNLYPFEQTIARPGVTDEQAIEMIDIGGPSMLRAAAKNHEFCLPVVDPADYPRIIKAYRENGPQMALRRELALKVFQETARYDAIVADYLAKSTTAADAVAPVSDGERDWPGTLTIEGVSRQSLRYGENPHQAAHFYMEPNANLATIARAKQLQGKELSYNNIQDADAALNILRGFDDFQTPVVVAVKHMNPCGIGIGSSIDEAYSRAHDADPVSIFGGIVALNRPVDGPLGDRLSKLFLEIIIAPAFSDDARAVLQKKKNLRLLTVDMGQPLWAKGATTWRRVSGGFLVQEVDQAAEPVSWNVVTKRQPTADEQAALRFAWRSVQFVKSNAIVLTNAVQTLGIGAGQMNRVGAAKIAVEQARAKAKGSVLGSDAFFPMRDTVEVAAAAGVTAIVQPGGSLRDDESIQAADEFGIAMVFTGARHFLH